jgi:RNA polymerase sigma-70 factor (ECF subfamily)
MQHDMALSWASEAACTASDAGLAQLALQERAAFAPLYHRYRDRVYWYVRTRTASEEDASDLTQQIFVQALDGLPRFRPERGPFAAWLFTIARNALANYRRRVRVTVTWDLLPGALQPPAADDLEAEVLHHEDLKRLRALFATLTVEKRELLILRFVAGLTAGEIAAVIGKSEAATRKHIARTLHALAERFEGDDHDLPR